MVNFTLPFTTNEMISISISQTFRSWVLIQSSSAYGIFISQLIQYAWLAPRINVLFWWPGDFRVSYSNYSWNAENRHSGSFMVDTGILSGEVSFSRMLNDILTLDKLQWLLHWSDFSLFLWPWYRAWPSPNYEWFPWSICNGCGTPAGNAYPSDIWFHPPFWTCLCSNRWDHFSRACRVFYQLFTLNTQRFFLDLHTQVVKV